MVVNVGMVVVVNVGTVVIVNVGMEVDLMKEVS